MRKEIPPYAFWLLAAIALAAGVGTRLITVPSPDLHFSFFDENGRTDSLKRWQGKLLIINFWASWCASCREEIPLLTALQKQYQGRVQLIGVAFDEITPAKTLAGRLGVNYPLRFARPTQLDILIRFGNQKRILPFTIAVDHNGALMATHVGPISAAELDEWARRGLARNRSALVQRYR